MLLWSKLLPLIHLSRCFVIPSPCLHSTTCSSSSLLTCPFYHVELLLLTVTAAGAFFFFFFSSLFLSDEQFTFEYKLKPVLLIFKHTMAAFEGFILVNNGSAGHKTDF